MNRSMLGSMSIGLAIEGFANAKLAEGLSQRTVDTYHSILNDWLRHIGDREMSGVTPQDITAYLTWLRTEYKPRRFGGKLHPLSGKTLRNIWATLSSFFTWAGRDLGVESPVKDIPAPRFARKQVPEFTREEVERMLRACINAKQANTLFRRSFAMRRPTAKRDQALLLVLLDTGLRASELCSLTVGDVDIKTGKVDVRHGIEGGAKGGKGRTVYLGRAARRAVWYYLASREDGKDERAPLYVVSGTRAMRPATLRQLITSIGKRAEVTGAFPHRFRHTFAITYLRSGGDVFTLQQLLGHSSLDMVRIYSRIAQSDVADAHRRASPVDSWRL